MKRFFFSLLLLGLSFVWFSFSQQLDFDPMAMPGITQYVEDFSHVLSASQLAELRTLTSSYAVKTTNQIVTVLFPHREGNNIFDIGMKVFKDNGIGQWWKDNWILLAIATEEKKIRIIVWYGLEPIITDAVAKRIVEAIRPSVDTWDYYSAVKLFSTLVIEKITTAESLTGSASWPSLGELSDAADWWVLMTLTGIFLWIFLPFWKKRLFPTKVKSFFWWKDAVVWKQAVGIILSYVLIILFFWKIYAFISWFPGFLSHLLWAFVPSFLLWFWMALLPPWTFFGGKSWSWMWWISSFFSSDSSSSWWGDSWWFDWWWGDSWGWWAGD